MHPQAMSRPTYNAILAHAARGKPALVFVPSRKHARLLALDLLTAAAADGEPSRFRLADTAVRGREGQFHSGTVCSGLSVPCRVPNHFAVCCTPLL